MQLLFQMEVQNDYSNEIKERFVQEHMKDSNQLEYFNSLFQSTVDNLPLIDEKLETCSENWKIKRMAKVESCNFKTFHCRDFIFGRGS